MHDDTLVCSSLDRVCFLCLHDATLLIQQHFFGKTDSGLSDSAAGIIFLVGSLLILCVALFIIVYQLKQLLRGRIAVVLHRSVNGQVLRTSTLDSSHSDRCLLPPSTKQAMSLIREHAESAFSRAPFVISLT